MKRVLEKRKPVVFIVALLFAFLFASTVLIITLATPLARTADGTIVEHPFSVTVDGREVALVKSKQDGKNALSKIVEEYTPDGTSIKRVDFDKKIEIKERKVKPFEKIRTVKDEEEIKEALIKKNESDDPLFTATVVSEEVQTKDIEPKVKFKYSDDMDVYEYKVEAEGKKGTKEISYLWVSENGDVTDKDKKEATIIDKPVDAVVTTGAPETPKSLKWEDYKKFQKKVKEEHSDAITGDKMIAYGEKHLGAPYKYGGHSYKTGIDCVAFVLDVYKKYGIDLPNKRSALAGVGKGVSLKNAKKGDIVYYGNHVALYYGNGKIIHATHKGISIRNINYRKWKTIRHVKK